MTREPTTSVPMRVDLRESGSGRSRRLRLGRLRQSEHPIAVLARVKGDIL